MRKKVYIVFSQILARSAFRPAFGLMEIVDQPRGRRMWSPTATRGMSRSSDSVLKQSRKKFSTTRIVFILAQFMFERAWRE